MSSTQRAFNFFCKHSGFSYDPKTQTPEQGRAENAQELMEAEAWAHLSGYFYSWDIDDFDTIENQCVSYTCAMVSPDGRYVAQVLGGITFGPDSEPGSYPPDRRVVEAELAAQQKRELGE